MHLIDYYTNDRLPNAAGFHFTLISNVDILQNLRNIESGAAGSDGVSLKMLRLCVPYILPQLIHLFNSCLLDGQFPEIWKESRIRPLPKISNPKTLIFVQLHTYL